MATVGVKGLISAVLYLQCTWQLQLIALVISRSHSLQFPRRLRFCFNVLYFCIGLRQQFGQPGCLQWRVCVLSAGIGASPTDFPIRWCCDTDYVCIDQLPCQRWRRIDRVSCACWIDHLTWPWLHDQLKPTARTAVPRHCSWFVVCFAALQTLSITFRH